MLPLLSSHYPWWFGLYRKTKMVECQAMNLEAWLQETSLFGDEPIDSINIDEIFSNEKANSKGHQTPLSGLDLEWFDEKVDFSVLDNPNGLLDHRNETKPSMEDDTAFLLGLLDSSFNPSQFDIFNNEEIDLSKQLDVQNFTPEPASSEIFDTHLASPRCNSLEVNSPAFFPVQSPASPYSDISEVPDESLSSVVLQSPEPSSVTSDFPTSSLDSSPVRVSVCDNVANTSSSEPVLSIEEVFRSVKKRKFVSDGESIPKVRVILAEGVPTASTPRPKDRRERKKVQNKEAAARYRIKKRMEEKVLSDEVADLESKQRKLQAKHDDLQSEIKYLKSLMCEILTKKGIMK